MSLCINPHCPQPQNPDNVLFCQSCGSDLILEGRYRPISLLGGGGFGKTYEAKEGNKAKVLKVLINKSPKAIELFQREAQVLSQLNHPGIPKVEPNSNFTFYPAGSQQPLHCFVMEKIEGLNLQEYVKQRGRPIDGGLAHRWLIELVTILQQVHDRGIWHRDIKPQNLILQPDGKLALIDFGAVNEGTGTELATQATGEGLGTELATHAGGGTSIGSTGYTPIEQINGQAVAQSDFFALGRTFIYLLTAKEPTDRSMYDALNDEICWQEHTIGISSQLADLISWMTARLPRERPSSTQEILQRLAEIDLASPPPSQHPSVQPLRSSDSEQSTTPVPPATPPVPPTSPVPPSSNKLPLLLGLGVAGVVSAISVYAILQWQSRSGTSQQPITSGTTSESCIVTIGDPNQNVHNLNVRSGANGQKTGKLIQPGTSLTVTGREENGWIEVSSPVPGWVFKQYTTNDCSKAITPTPNVIVVETNQDQNLNTKTRNSNDSTSSSNPTSNSGVNSSTKSSPAQSDTRNSNDSTSSSNPTSNSSVNSNTEPTSSQKQIPESAGEDPTTMCDPSVEPC